MLLFWDDRQSISALQPTTTYILTDSYHFPPLNETPAVMLFLFIELYPLSVLQFCLFLNLLPFSFNYVIITYPNPPSRVRNGVKSTIEYGHCVIMSLQKACYGDMWIGSLI